MMFLWILKEGGDSGVEDGIQVVSGVDGCESGKRCIMVQGVRRVMVGS